MPGDSGGSIGLRPAANTFLTAGVCVVSLLSLARLDGPRGTIGGLTYVLGAVAIVLVVAGAPLLAWRSTRAQAGLTVAIGLGMWSGLYVGLQLLL